MRITTLVENRTRNPRLKAEHGLSFLIESGGLKILSDTGQSRAFMENAETLGVDLAGVDALVISHAHYDHGGGIAHFFETNSTVPVYMSTHVQNAFYAIGGPKIDGVIAASTNPRYIGLPPSLFERTISPFIFVTENTTISKGIHILSDIGRAHPSPPGNGSLYEERDSRLEPDTFRHELLLVVAEADGMVLFSGCGHSGILNMIDAARRHLPHTPIKAIVGGLHLIPMADDKAGPAHADYVETLAQALVETEVGVIYTGHCTGDAALKILKRHLNNRVAGLHCGARFEM